MKFINFNTLTEKETVNPSILRVCYNQEVVSNSLNNDDREVYLVMVNHDFDAGYYKDGINVRGAKYICIMPEVKIDDLGEKVKYWQGMYLNEYELATNIHNSEERRAKLQTEIEPISFGGLFDLSEGEDVSELLNEAKFCYGARNKEELQSKISEFNKFKESQK